MTAFERAVPVLPVADTAAAVAFYVDRLGFRVRQRDAGHAVLARDAVELRLWAARDQSWRERRGWPPVETGAESFLAGTASCRIGVDAIEALHEACTRAGIVHPNAPLAERPWGLVEFAVLDPDGNLITFFRPADRRPV
jgi:catechol 2,3-dioxygenase-like lactoylglutathione lyase family enzyme